MNRTLHILTIIGLVISGCGDPHQYHVKEWKYATFIDSSTIGAVSMEYLETYPNQSGIGETYPDLTDFHAEIVTLSRSGEKLKTIDSFDITGQNYHDFFSIHPFLVLTKSHYPFTCCVYNLTTGGKNILKDGLKIYSPSFSWNLKYYFRGYSGYVPQKAYYNNNYVDTNYVYETETNSIVATFYNKTPFNVDRSGTKILLVNDTTLEYYNLIDKTYTPIRCSYTVFVTDYRFGRVALTILDSAYAHIMLPDLDTLPIEVYSLDWIHRYIPSSSVLNLKNGERFDCQNHIDLYNLTNGDAKKIIKEDRVRIQ